MKIFKLSKYTNKLLHNIHLFTDTKYQKCKNKKIFSLCTTKVMCIHTNWYKTLVDILALFTLRENTLIIVQIRANSHERW